MNKSIRSIRLLSLVLIGAVALSAAAPLVACAEMASRPHDMPSEAPCPAPCCAFQAPDGRSASSAQPLAVRDDRASDGENALFALPDAGASLALVCVLAFDLATESEAAASRLRMAGDSPSPGPPVRLHVFHAAFLN